MSSLKRFAPPLFVVLWSTGFIGARYAMPWIEPFTFLFIRFGAAFLILGVIAFATGKAMMSAREIRVSLLAGVLMHGLYLGAVFWAIHKGMPAGLTALIVGLQPLITAGMAGLLLNEEIKPRQWAGLAGGLIGVAIVIWPKLHDGAGSVSWVMLVVMVLAVISISFGTILQKKLGATPNLVMGTAWQYVGAAVLTGIGSLFFETRQIVVNGELVFATVWLVLVLSIGAIFLLMAMIREGAMAKIASLFYLVPAVTALLAWLLFREQMTLTQLGGMALTTVAVGLATAVSLPGRPAPARPDSGGSKH